MQGLVSRHERRLCAALQEGIHQDTSPVYGDGFRAAWRASKLRSLQELVRYVQNKQRFPN